MTEAGFLDELGAILDQQGPLARGQKLGEIETFDSLGILNIMALFDTLGLEVEPSQIAKAATTDDLLGIAVAKLQS
ncbi:hypothetical protein [Methylobacterium sp. J-070]|uniref:hypothetical protein n=1 Tax=Methylobacterium sp. J-070 TaxID=2836650 RepID=UPI001FB93C0F|nr:hypothetical protein [Methylobacterium sp. J-070]MCJ2054906.1 hypothetical protein [Methylobacterium sp. J-070]